MSCSNMPRLWGLVTAAATYEGENTVLQLQVCGKKSFHLLEITWKWKGHAVPLCPSLAKFSTEVVKVSSVSEVTLTL